MTAVRLGVQEGGFGKGRVEGGAERHVALKLSLVGVAPMDDLVDLVRCRARHLGVLLAGSSACVVTIAAVYANGRRVYEARVVVEYRGVSVEVCARDHDLVGAVKDAFGRAESEVAPRRSESGVWVVRSDSKTSA